MGLTHGSATCLPVTLDRLLSFSSPLVPHPQNDLPSRTEVVRNSSADVQGLAHSRCSIHGTIIFKVRGRLQKQKDGICILKSALPYVLSQMKFYCTKRIHRCNQHVAKKRSVTSTPEIHFLSLPVLRVEDHYVNIQGPAFVLSSNGVTGVPPSRLPLWAPRCVCAALAHAVARGCSLLVLSALLCPVGLTCSSSLVNSAVGGPLGGLQRGVLKNSDAGNVLVHVFM